MASKEKQSLDDVIKNVNKKWGANIVGYGIPKRDYTRIPFTSPRMNYCTYGGLATGRLYEFFGEEGGGKTSSALDIVGNFQNIESSKESPKKCVYIDAEHTLDVGWATKLGVDVDNLVLIQPEEQSAEEIFQIALDFISTNSVGLVILDSIPALSSDQELGKDMTEKTYAGISGPLTTFSRKAETLCKKYDCMFIGINQIRDDLNAMWSGAVKTPGGRGWKHFVSARFQFTKGSFINEAGDEIKRSSESPAGNIVLMNMIKNKTCPPNRRGGFYTIRYDSGIDYLRDLLDVAIKYDLIQKSGAWFTIVNPDTGEVLSEKIQGMNNVYQFFMDEENEPILQIVEDYIDSKIC